MSTVQWFVLHPRLQSILEHFPWPKKRPCAFLLSFPKPSIPNLLTPVNTNLLSVSLDLPVPDISYGWNWITCSLL